MRQLHSTIVVIVLNIYFRKIEETLVEATSWLGCEQLFSVLIPQLVKRFDKGVVYIFHHLSNSSLFRLEDSHAANALELLIQACTDSAEVHDITHELLLHTVAGEVSATFDSRRLLRVIQQRHPNVLSDACKRVIDDGSEKRDAVEQLILALSVVRLPSWSPPKFWLTFSFLTRLTSPTVRKVDCNSLM